MLPMFELPSVANRIRSGATDGWILPRLSVLAAFFALLFLTGRLTAVAEAQETGQVAGQVVAAESQAPLAGVQVFLEGLAIGGLSRANGSFVLVGVPAGTHELVAQYIGYATLRQEISVTPGGSVEVNLEIRSQALGLEELVVTGTAGAARRREIGNTISQINADDIPAKPVRATDMLQAQAPGINILGSGGDIGQGSRIRLRGNASVSMSNEPIIYIDGVRMQAQHFPQTTARDYRQARGANITASPLDNLNPNDIERIEVIKGSAATTLYGTDASSGVIQIFTKRGAEGAPIWSAEVQQGAAWARKDGPPSHPYMRMDPHLRTGHNQHYFLSVRGGGEDLQYFVSGQFSDETGIQLNDYGEKYTVRGNFTFSPRSDLRVSWNSMYANQWLKNTTTGGNAQGVTLNAYRGDANYFGDGSFDVVKQLYDYDIQTWIERFTTGATVTYSPLVNFTNRLQVGYDFAEQEARQVRPFGFVFFPQGSVMNNTWQNRVLTLDYAGTYSFNIASGFRSSFSWGGQAIGDEVRELEGWGENFPGAASPTVSSASLTLAEEGRQKIWTAGVFFQNVFDIRDKYFFTVGLRVDGNSAFGEGFGLQPYPKASVSWVASDENWWSNSWADQLRVRAAYGQSGRAPGAFDAVRTWDARGYGDLPGFIPRNVGNADLGPEVSEELEFGFDASWGSDRFGADVTYYLQRTRDALFAVTQTPSRGFIGSQLENVGELENRGLELGLTTTPVRSVDWEWDLGLNLTTNRSEVTDIGGAAPFSIGTGAWVVEGQPLPVMRGRVVTNPDDIGAEPEIVDDYNYGPNQPTRTISGNTTIRVPGGIRFSARGEWFGGNYVGSRWSGSVGRNVQWPACWPYYQNPGVDTELRDDIPAIWRARCDPLLSQDSFVYVRADYFRLRSASVEVPVDFLLPDAAQSGVLTFSLENVWTVFTGDWIHLDPETSTSSGAASDVIYAGARVAPPKHFRVALRVTF